MVNPIKKIVNESGLSLISYSILNGISISTLKSVYYGNVSSIPKKVKSTLKKQKHDIGVLDKEYQEWLLWKAKQELKAKS